MYRITILESHKRQTGGNQNSSTGVMHLIDSFSSISQMLDWHSGPCHFIMVYLLGKRITRYCKVSNMLTWQSIAMGCGCGLGWCHLSPRMCLLSARILTLACHLRDLTQAKAVAHHCLNWHSSNPSQITYSDQEKLQQNTSKYCNNALMVMNMVLMYCNYI